MAWPTSDSRVPSTFQGQLSRTLDQEDTSTLRGSRSTSTGSSIIWTSRLPIVKPHSVSPFFGRLSPSSNTLSSLLARLLAPCPISPAQSHFSYIGRLIILIGCIEYLRRFGYSDYQCYLLLGCAPVQGHVAGIVDIPNACTTLGLPMDIFDFDISPSGPAKKMDMGTCAFETGVTEGKVTEGGKNSEFSFGGGMTYKS